MENLPIQVEEMQAGELALVSREQSEIQSSIIIAKKFPRNEQAAFVKMNKSLERVKLAEAALYAFPRGGKTITGPSVDMARELARCWGNIRFGLRIVSLDKEMVQIKGFAFDMEANNYIEAEDKFLKLVQRKDKQTGKTTWVEPDERDLRELINRRGAVLVRNCILQIVPSDLIDDAIAKVKETLRKADEGKLGTNRDDTIKKLVLEYDKLGVTVEMIDKYLGHAIATIDAAELADLRQVFRSVFNGEVKREDVFELGKTSADLNKDLGLQPEEGKKAHKKKKEDPAPEPEKPAEPEIRIG